VWHRAGVDGLCLTFSHTDPRRQRQRRHGPQRRRVPAYALRPQPQ
jgi:hypothetical protein